MKVLAVGPDVQALAAGLLRSVLAARTEPFAAGAGVGTRPPRVSTPEAPLLPWVQVALDGNLPRYPIASRCTLRITAWHADEDQAHDLAQLCQGLLLTHDGTALSSVRPGSGPLPAVDTDTGIDVSTLTVIAMVRYQRIT